MLQRKIKQLNSPISSLAKSQKINNSLQEKFSTKRQLSNDSHTTKINTARIFDIENKKPAVLQAHTGLNEINFLSNTMITKEVAAVQASTGKKSANPDKQEKTRKSEIATDTEFQPVTDDKTLPVCTIVNDPTRPDIGKKIFLHPNAPIPEDKRLHPTFKAPLAAIDYYGWQWRLREANKKPKNYQNIDLNIFFSYKDIEFNCADEELYRKYILPYLDRIRRIRNLQPLAFPIDVYTAGNDGVMRWRCLTVDISDISAMQGAEGLITYASNVGMNTDSKEYTPEEKAQMLSQYINDSVRFEKYCLGIETELIEIKELTTEKYNYIATEILGLEAKESWGLSTGKIVATMVSEWIAKKLGIKVENLFKLSTLASPDGIKTLSKFIRNKELLYLGMTDGGRAVKERDIDCIVGALIDIDIDGCYGNGLKNQPFAVGHPDIIQKCNFGDFFKKYNKQLIPGLWVARISWDDAPFNQDLLISKVEEAFTIWDMAVTGDKEGFILSDEDKVYEASMVLTTQSVKNAVLNHDLLQVLRKVASNQEWGWILKNAVIESAAIYQAKNEVKEVTEKMINGIKLIEDSNTDVLLECTKQWVSVDLSELAEKLIKERKKYPKGTSMNVFLKLIINTIYGTIASAFFTNQIAGVSNYVIGNNITARARTLAWCMGKGLNSIMSITDGGVFDANKVLKYSRMSLHLLERIHTNKLNIEKQRSFGETVSLLGHEIKTDKTLFKQLLTPKDLIELPNKIKIGINNAKEIAKELNIEFTTKDLSATVKAIVKSTALKNIDIAAWEHLAAIFTGVDIFTQNQFKFESKDAYQKLTIHSKVDYRLVRFDDSSTIALRGMNRIYDAKKKKKVNNPIAHELFDAIEENRPHRIEIDTTQLLSLADWKKHERKDYLLPHDQVSKKKRFYSITHLGTRFKNDKHYRRFHKLYMTAKDNDSAEEMSKIREILEKEFN